MPPAGRPREFDPEVALEAAMEAFWLQGYGGTSMSDLEEATGLGKGSLYKAFGDKQSLFIQALAKYEEYSFREMGPRIAAAANATEAVRSFLDFALCRGVSDDGCRRGCMAANTVTELANEDPVVIEFLQKGMKKMMAVLTGLIEQGQATGEFRSDATAESLAEFLAMLNVGLSTYSKAGFANTSDEALIELALSALQAPNAR